MLGIGGLEVAYSDPHARETLEVALALARSGDDSRAQAPALGLLAMATNDESIATAGVELSRAGGYDWERAFALSRRAEIVARHDMARAMSDLAESLRVARTIGNPGLLATTLTTAGFLAAGRGDMPEARARLADSLVLFERTGDRRFAHFVRSELAHLERRAGNDERALALHRRTIVAWMELGHRAAVAHQLESLAAIAGNAVPAGRDMRRAAQLFGAAEALREDVGAPMSTLEQAEYGHAVGALREGLDEQIFEQAWADGRAMTLEQAVAYALEETNPE